MPPPHDLEPDIMSDDEKRQRRRFDAAFAFERMSHVVSRSQFGGQNPSDPLRAFEIEE